jgi:hypothetical protein
VHLATEFQNMIYDSKHFPKDLKDKMYAWLKVNAANERKETDTDDRSIQGSQESPWRVQERDNVHPAATRDAIAAELEARFEFLFKQLGAVNNKQVVDKFVHPQTRYRAQEKSRRRASRRRRRRLIEIVKSGPIAD